MSPTRSSPIRLWLATAMAVAIPAAACAAPLTLGGVVADAAPLIKLLVLGLVLASIAALVVCGLKLASGPRLSGGSAYLSGLRAGGPLAGLLGAAYVALNIFLGVANAPAAVPFREVAPGLAEAVLLIGLGLLSGAVATAANWAVEARIDRAVLRP